MADEPRQFWIRNEQGKVWGPISFATIEVLLDNQAMTGKLQASRDGLAFVWPGRLPELREAFPKELWGDTSDPLPDPSGRPAPPTLGTPPRGMPSPVGLGTPPAGMPAQGRPVQPARPPPVVPGVARVVERAVPPPGGPPVVGPVGARPPSSPPVASPPAEPPPSRAPSSPPVAQPVPQASAPVAPAPAPAPAKAPSTPPEPTDGVPSHGSLAEYPPFRLYYLAATTNQTGRLTLTGTEASYEVFFKKGSPEAVRSSLESEDLGSFLVKKGALASDKLAEVRKNLGSFGGELVNALFGMQLLNPADAFRFIGEHAQGLLGRAFTVEGGSFAFDPAAAPPSTAMPLGDRWKLICDMVRAIPVVDLKARLGRRMLAPVMKSGGRVELAQLKLTPQEARATSYFDGVRSLNQLCAALPAEADVIVRTAFLLFRFEAASFAEGVELAAAPEPEPAPEPAPEELPELDLAAEASPEPSEAPTPKPQPRPEPPPAAPAPPPAAPKPAVAQPRPQAAVNPGRPPVIGGPGAAKPGPPVVKPAAKPAPAAPPAPAANPAQEVASLKAYAEGLKGKNHFEVFGVAQNATSAQIKTAFFQLAKKFHPDTVQSGAPAEVGKYKAEIFARINEANGVLSDEKRRAAYLDELQSGLDKMDAEAIFKSEETFQWGCVLLKGRKYPEALAAFEECIGLYDKEGEYYAWRGWAKFLVAQDKKAIKDEALKDLDQGIQMSPRCAQAVYLKGQIFKLLGDAATAQKLFRETLQLDANHLEAQREVRQR